MPRKKSQLGKKGKEEKRLQVSEIVQEAFPAEQSILTEKRDLKDLAKDIVASYDARVKIVGGIIDDTHEMMANLKTKREDMSKDLREALAGREFLRKKDFDRMMADIITQQNRREEEVKKMLEDFRKEEEMVADKLRNLLKRGEEVRIGDFKKMMAEIKQGQEKRIQTTNESVTDQLQRMQEEVHTMLDNFKTERQSVASAWHEMLGLFRTERSPANPGNLGENAEEDVKNNDDNA